MGIRIVHTADNHIGMKFSSYSDGAKGELISERLAALKSIVQLANEKKADFVVIAGDLFDSINVKSAIIKAVSVILNEFSGEAVIVVPGNHDFYEESVDSLWGKFKKEVDQKKIIVLSEYKPIDLSVGDQKVIFYPCCCKSLHSSENMIGWVQDTPKDTSAINIGIAHGNVTGLGLDEVDRYFNMNPSDLKEAGLDFWLLGHIHVPFPKTTGSENPYFFFSGTHVPDGWNSSGNGNCWFIEIGSSKKIKYESVKTSDFNFFDWSRVINSLEQFEKLKKEIDELKKEKSLIRLELNGRLDEESLETLKKEVEKIGNGFLTYQVSNLIKINIDAKYINSNYVKDSLPHKLLSSLANSEKDELALQLANELIENLKP